MKRRKILKKKSQSRYYVVQPENRSRTDVDWECFELKIGGIVKLAGMLWNEEDFSDAIESATGKKPCPGQLSEMLTMISAPGRASYFPRGDNPTTGLNLGAESQKIKPDRVEIKFDKKKNRFEVLCYLGRAYLKNIDIPYLENGEKKIRKILLSKENSKLFPEGEWPEVYKFSRCSYTPPDPKIPYDPASFKDRFHIENSMMAYGKFELPLYE
jgi:hypothetical protein